MKLYAIKWVEWSHMPIYVLAEDFDHALRMAKDYMARAKPPIQIKEIECLAEEKAQDLFVEVEAA